MGLHTWRGKHTSKYKEGRAEEGSEEEEEEEGTNHKNEEGCKSKKKGMQFYFHCQLCLAPYLILDNVHLFEQDLDLEETDDDSEHYSGDDIMLMKRSRVAGSGVFRKSESDDSDNESLPNEHSRVFTALAVASETYNSPSQGLTGRLDARKVVGMSPTTQKMNHCQMNTQSCVHNLGCSKQDL